MLMPKRVKRRKQFRGSMKGKALRGNKITNGEYGIVAMEPCWIRSNQIEAARVAMTRYIKRGGQVWIKILHLHGGMSGAHLSPDISSRKTSDKPNGSTGCHLADTEPESSTRPFCPLPDTVLLQSSDRFLHR